MKFEEQYNQLMNNENATIEDVFKVLEYAKVRMAGLCETNKWLEDENKKLHKEVNRLLDIEADFDAENEILREKLEALETENNQSYYYMGRLQNDLEKAEKTISDLEAEKTTKNPEEIMN